MKVGIRLAKRLKIKKKNNKKQQKEIKNIPTRHIPKNITFDMPTKKSPKGRLAMVIRNVFEPFVFIWIPFLTQAVIFAVCSIGILAKYLIIAKILNTFAVL